MTPLADVEPSDHLGALVRVAQIPESDQVLVAGSQPGDPLARPGNHPRRIHDLIEASSLGTRDAVALRKQACRDLAPDLTGVPEEQTDWDSDEEATDD